MFFLAMRWRLNCWLVPEESILARVDQDIEALQKWMIEHGIIETLSTEYVSRSGPVVRLVGDIRRTVRRGTMSRGAS